MSRIRLGSLLLALLALLTTPVVAELQYLGQDALGNGLIYDTGLDVTWYDYTNPPDTWFNHTAWAENLTVTFGANTYDDWRLPTNPDGSYAPLSYSGSLYAGWNYTNSDLGHLFYVELGNVGSRDTSGGLTGCGNPQPTCLVNFEPFQNLVVGRYYASDHAGIPQYAWYFDTNSGSQYVTPNYTSVDYGIALRPGLASSEPVAQERTQWGALKTLYR
jgi:hypothetical protein